MCLWLIVKNECNENVVGIEIKVEGIILQCAFLKIVLMLTCQIGGKQVAKHDKKWKTYL